MAVTLNYDLDIDSTLGGDNASDYVIPSQKAIKSYVDNNSVIPSNMVTTDTAQNITGVKTFVGQKMIGFKQSASGNKLGFTLYNNNNVEKGYLEYNPSNLIDNVPLMTLGNYATATTGLTHVGFRKYSSISGASGAYNLLAPLISDARTPFNLTTTYTNFYLPLGFTDGNTTVLTAKTGLVDLSSLLPSLSGYATEAWVGQQGYALASSLSTVATSGSYADLIDTPTIPTVNNATLTITQGGVSKGTFTANASSDVTIELDAGGSGAVTDVQINGTSITSSNVANIITNSAYNSSSNKIATMSDLPTVNNATLTIQKNGTTVKTFTANASSNVTCDITVPTKISDLTDDTSTTPIDKADYATSAGIASSATTASTLGSTDVGSATQGIYLDDGTPKACTYTVSKSVPSDAVFTDTDTKVTQSVSSTNSTYPILLCPTANATTDQGATTSIFASGVKVNPSTKTITATTFDGNATTATTASKLGSADKGSATQPIYLSGGAPTACTYTLAKSVPSDAVFTDTNTLMTQNVSSTNATYPILLCPTANATVNQGAKTGIFASGVKVNPSTSTISATFSGNLTGNVTGNCSGSSGSCTGNAATATYATSAGSATSATSATTATKLGSSTVGGTTTPIYLDGGTPTPLSYTIAKSVPSNAVFTDTTYANGTGITIGTGNAINHSNSVTAGTAGTSSATSGSTLAVPYVTYDAQGHVTASGTHTHTVTGFSTTDTKNTAGSTDTSSKIFLVGATSQAANPQTYSHDTAFVDTSGQLNSANPSASTNSTVVATTKWVTDKGYTSNTGTVTSVNNVSPVNGNVSLTIPTVNNATLTIQKNGTTVKTFTANASTDVTANITVPTKVSELTNDSGYTSNTGTVTSVNNVLPVNGNVSLTIPTYNFSGEPFYSTNGNATTITRDCNGLTANGHYYYTSNGPSGLGEQSTDGALYVQGYNDLWVTQIAQDYRTGNLFTRSRNSGTWTSWKAIGTSSGANTDLSNLTATGKAVIDGQWTWKYLSVATNTAANSYQHDLSSYLPNDNYSYEIYLTIACYYKSANASFSVGTVASPNTNKTSSGNYHVFQYVSSYARGGYCAAILPVGTSRKIYSQITALLDNSSIELYGYRRIGTNT